MDLRRTGSQRESKRSQGPNGDDTEAKSVVQALLRMSFI